jgi:ABC-type branched-subunit amino acid transport system substrate-binding protein/outer membrane protein assembly factor BamD (BamD/ComL family)
MSSWKNRRGWFILFIPLFLLTFSQCAMFEKAPKVKYPNQVTPEAEAAFNQAERDFNEKKYPSAATGFNSFLEAFPYNRLSDEAMYRLGQIQMLDSQYSKAGQSFDNLINKTPDPAVASRARVKAGISAYRLKNFDSALSYFNRVEALYLREHDLVKAGGLALIILKQQNASLEKKAYYYAMLADGYQGLSDDVLQKRFGAEAPGRAEVMEQLSAWAKTPASPSDIDPRFKSYQGPVSGPFINQKLGRAPAKAVQGGQIKVGVILPLTGKYEQFGQGTLKGMNCAVGTQAGCTDASPVQLVTRDDAGSPTEAVKAVEDLVNIEKVQVIVGPLSSTSALAAAKRAQELGVVMISLAQKEGIPEVGENIFRFSLTPNQQIKALLLYVTKKRGKNKIGVFYPNNNYGQVFDTKFKETAPAFGAEVTASHAYQDSKNVSDDLRNLKFSVGKTSPEAPIGFNAIFIPDSFQSILNILPQFKVSGLEGILLLGTNAWNDSELANRSGGDLSDVLFLDIYFKGSKNARVKKFVQEYQVAFGQTPTTLEAMGYDIIKFIGHVAARKRAKSVVAWRDGVMSVSDFEGVTGLRAFASNREARLRPFMLTVRNAQIEEVE